MTARPNPRIVAIARLVDSYAILANEALDHLHRELVHADGMPATSIGDGMPRGGGGPSSSRSQDDDNDDGPEPSTSVERAMLSRIRIAAQRDQIYDDISTLGIVLDSAMKVARRAQGMRVPVEVARSECSSTGRDGAEVWGVACWDLATKSGLCHRCYMREYRWRKAHGFAPRDIQEAVA